MGIFKKYNESNVREIRPGDPDKKGIALFWELFTRKFWNYIKLNLLYVVTSCVSLVFYWAVLAMFVVPAILDTIPRETLEEMAVASKSTVEMFSGSVIFFFSAIGAILLVTFYGGGVCTAGFSYVLRNYVRQENAYVFSDYFARTKENFGQALAVSVIDKILVSICMFSIAYYFGDIVKNGSAVSIFAFGILIFAMLLYAAMHTYIWTVMVTFKVTLKQLYKNSFMLTFGTATRSIVYMLCLAAFTVASVIIFAYSPIVTALVFFLILMSLFGLAGQLFSYPVIKKYMIDNNNSENKEGNEL